MLLTTWILYVTTVLVLMSTPGPSQLLMLSNSASNGFRRALATACGDLTANFFQMLAAGFGLAALLAASAHALTIIKWLGVIYLIWLGLKMILKSNHDGLKNNIPDEKPTLKALWFQGFFTSAANPKAVIFFAALFPQFIDPNLNFTIQFIILSATYILIDGLFLSVYGISANWLAGKLKGSAKKWVDRVGGIFMISAAILLGLKTAADK